MNRRFLALLILIFAAVIGWFVYNSEQSSAWWSRPFKLGLDLRGGSHLVYEADTKDLPASEIKDAMTSLRGVIERRINAFGVAEPVIQVEQIGLGTEAKHRLIVELPGVTDLKEAMKTIQVTPLLEFKTERPDGEEKEAILAAYKKFQANMVVEGGGATTTGSITAGADMSAAELALLQEDPYFISSGLTGRYLKRAQVQFGSQSLSPSISLEFNDDGAKLFAALTKANVEKPLAIYLDGQLLSAPTVREEIRDGRAEISGQFTVDEARELTRNLNLGALPVPIKLISTETVGATLGQVALDKGLRAGILGFIIVAVFMLLWYRLPGLVSVISLAIYVTLMLTIFKLLPVTLTAAGLAGFILSVGMAVDANILIFERLKEEMRRTDNMHDAIDHGFSRAWLSIRDSNLSSIISALILFWFGTALIKGFALTLGIGVLVSMFTAITVTRTFLRSLGVAHAHRLNRFLFSSGFSSK